MYESHSSRADASTSIGLPLTAIARHAVVLFMALAMFPNYARAVCGDTNGDLAVDTSDALRTLKKAVGQDVAMACSGDGDVPTNELSFVNTLLCGGLGFYATFTWSEHPEMSWLSYSDTTFPVQVSNYQRIDDLEMGGVLTFDFGTCGTRLYDLDAQGMRYLLPNYAASSVDLLYQESDNKIYVFLEVVPVPTSSSMLQSVTTSVKQIAIGVLDAPPGVSGVE